MLTTEHSLPVTEKLDRSDDSKAHNATVTSRQRAARVYEARERLQGVTLRTPTVYTERLGGWLKLENLQHTGAYKVRGAYNAVAAAVERGDRRGIVAASAGNHASGVAYAAQRLGLEAWTVMPLSAPLSKLAMTARYGARVVVHGQCFEEAWAHAEMLAESRGLRLLHAFDDPDVIAGQGTLGVELRELLPDVVIVPVGGGGLAAGVGLALQGTGVKLIGVQVRGVDAMHQALSGRGPLSLLAPTIADGICVTTPGELTRRICAEVLDDLIILEEAEVRQAVVEMAEVERIVVEGAGALAAAAMRKVDGQRKVAVVSGGNIDLEQFARLVSARRDVTSPHLGTPTPSGGSSLFNTRQCLGRLS